MWALLAAVSVAKGEPILRTLGTIKPDRRPQTPTANHAALTAIMTAPIRTMLICTEARTGCTWFSQLIRSTAVLGHPEEYFHENRYKQLHWIDSPTLLAREIIRGVINDGTTANGVCASKITSHHFARFAQLGRLSEFLPDIRYVRLARLDVLGQAISLERAQQTKQWGTRRPSLQEPRYDGASILSKLNRVLQSNAAWDRFFARTAITPLRLTYERLMADVEGVIRQVAMFIDVEGPVSVDTSQVRHGIQRDALSQEWRARFIAESGDPDRFELFDARTLDGTGL